ncbi:MAG: hypothetical protein AAGI66_02540 [Cyanobacteria bacterium P01_H01_bin.74]
MNNTSIWLIAIVSVLGVFLRFCNLDATTLWIDEIYSLMVANTHLPPERPLATPQSAISLYQTYLAWQPLAFDQLLAMLKINVHLPLYYCLLNPWLAWFQNTAAGLRSFSALCSAIALFPVFMLTKQGYGTKAATLALVFMAFSPFQLYFAQEGRMYALALLLCSFSAYLFWQLLTTPERNANTQTMKAQSVVQSATYALCTTAAVLTHYTVVFFLGFQVLFFWAYAYSIKQHGSGQNQKLVLKRLALFLPGLVLIAGVGIAWLPIYTEQVNGLSSNYHFAKGLASIPRIIGLPIWHALVFAGGNNHLQRIFYFPLCLVLIAGFVSVIWKTRGQGKAATISKSQNAEANNTNMPMYSYALHHRQVWFLGFIACWYSLPIGLLIAYDFIKNTHSAVMDRYVMLSSPAVYIAMAIGFCVLSRLLNQKTGLQWSRKIQATVVLAVAALGVLAVYSPSPFRDNHNKSKPIRSHIKAMVNRSKPASKAALASKSKLITGNLPLMVVNGPWGAALIAAYYSHQFNPQQPILYWMSPYRKTDIPLPDKTLFAEISTVWLFRYRANNERGLQKIKDHLASMYPQKTKMEDGFLYRRP